MKAAIDLSEKGIVSIDGKLEIKDINDNLKGFETEVGSGQLGIYRTIEKERIIILLTLKNLIELNIRSKA